MRNGFKMSALAFVATLVPLAGCGGSESSVAPTPTTANLCTNITYAAPSGAANNIVFTFDKAYTCGQFANGDWWVTGDAGGPVTITSITPAASGGRHGFQVNPTSTTEQAFDNRSSTPYNATLMPALPLTVAGVSSVVKTVSKSVTGMPKLQFAAVLTVVSSPVVNSSTVFRPGYFGTAGKTSYSVPNSGTIAGLPLGTYSPTGVPDSTSFTIPNVATRYQHLQLDLGGGWTARDLHPADNMPDYGAQIATDNAAYLLRMLLSDFNYSNSTHKQALINYLQMVIDIKSVSANGGIWGADGGHGNGRKLPLQFANMVFGGSDFSNAIAASAFSEDQQVYRSVLTGEVLWGKTGTESDYWRSTLGALGESTAGGARDIRDYYGRIDGGGYEVGTIGYQFCCTSLPWKYTVLALYMLGLETPPASLPISTTNNLVEYVERWVRYGVKAADTTTNINLTTGAITPPVPHGLPVCMRPAVPAVPPAPAVLFYGADYGPNGLGGCIVGTNNWTGVDNTSVNAGYYGSPFGNQLWAWYRP